ncbi:MAG: DUF2066 domain-containing protein [Proteobacteria bacterium]|nr:DUF2066 domain-containing protein [Pseudomonadota bacterium]
MVLTQRLVALIAVAWWGLVAPPQALAKTVGSAVFSVAGVAVDVTASDAAEAKAQAVALGQRRALDRLFRRLVPVSDYQRLAVPDDGAITELVGGFEVADERVAPNRYIASLTFHFKPNDISRLLRDQGIPHAVTPSQPVVVLPLYRAGEELLLWEDGNLWRAAWANLPLPDGLIRVIVPLGELADVVLIDARQADEGRRDRLAILAERYGTGDVAIAEATASLDPLLDIPTVQVALRRFQEEGVRIGGGTYSGLASDALTSVLAVAAKATRTQLEEEWKEANLLRYDREGTLAVDIPVKSLADWLDIHRRLVDVALVRKTELEALSPRFARVLLHYLGDVSHLAGALANGGLELIRDGDLWVLRRPAAAARAAAASAGSPAAKGSASE